VTVKDPPASPDQCTCTSLRELVARVLEQVGDMPPCPVHRPAPAPTAPSFALNDTAALLEAAGSTTTPADSQD
jgi:hypothetical protein